MFKYSSTHVINSLTNVKAYKSDGTSEGIVAGTATNYLLVDTDAKFTASAITKIDKATAVDPAVESVSFAMPSTLTSGANCRMYIYVRTTNQADPEFANDWIYKGKPFQIEFKAGSTDILSATNFVKNVGKWINFQYGKKLITASNIVSDAASATVTLTFASGEYDLRFYKIRIEQFTEATSANDYKYNFYADGAFTTAAYWCSSDAVYTTAAKTAIDTSKDQGDNTLTVTYATVGNSGFGTYMYLLKNLRLPTNANTAWLSPVGLAGELPMVDKKYTQYIITQCTERPEVQGTSVVGQYNKSVTKHILWIESSLVTNFETELAKIYTANQKDTVTGHKDSETNLYDETATVGA